jgi:hypothetical protein
LPQDAAGQLRQSPHQFSSIGATSPLLFLARGYAVLDGPTMPIVAEGDEEANDTYVRQLTASARAAVEVWACLGLCRVCKDWLRGRGGAVSAKPQWLPLSLFMGHGVCGEAVRSQGFAKFCCA